MHVCAKLVDAQCSTTTTTSANTTISDNLGSEFSQLCFFAPQNNQENNAGKYFDLHAKVTTRPITRKRPDKTFLIIPHCYLQILDLKALGVESSKNKARSEAYS